MARDAGIISLYHVKHATSVTVLVFFIVLSALIRRDLCPSDFSAVERYGVALSILFYFMQLTILASLPFSMFNFLGLVLLNVFRPSSKLVAPLTNGPFLCFRVVTRGLYPNLVNQNVRYNRKVCEKAGLRHYSFEVVTDTSVQLQPDDRSREIVVPAEYMTPNGALFKARALQYTLEPDVNVLRPEDWIVHLDEETMITEDAVIGIMNFVRADQHSFGQGVITYGRGTIVNWITTLADSIRVGIDYGCYRFTLDVLHKPIFNWKGSFIVAKVKAEMDINFDHGPEASIAEDCYFACLALSRGHSFGFVEGEMTESSTFTLQDFVQQRRRWMHGILLTALSRKIPLRYKLGPVLLTISNFLMPLNFLLFPLGIIWPMPMLSPLTSIYGFVLGTVVYLYLLGTLQTFSIKHCGFVKLCFLLVTTIPCGLLACLLENVSSCLVFWNPKHSLYTFHIVKKEVHRVRTSMVLYV